ncbi:hypothetical protein [Streptomyces sp. NPDC058572]|uniref:hypothetical protein n=1 Tax=Streptomyces sp. NPDC058572 TaxID=3346546 RepID=UPI003650FEC7
MEQEYPLVRDVFPGSDGAAHRAAGRRESKGHRPAGNLERQRLSCPPTVAL